MLEPLQKRLYLCQKWSDLQSETTVGKLRTSCIISQKHGGALIRAGALNGDYTVVCARLTDQKIPGSVSCRCQEPGCCSETPPRWHVTISYFPRLSDEESKCPTKDYKCPKKLCVRCIMPTVPDIDVIFLFKCQRNT